MGRDTNLGEYDELHGSDEPGFFTNALVKARRYKMSNPAKYTLWTVAGGLVGGAALVTIQYFSKGYNLWTLTDMFHHAPNLQKYANATGLPINSTDWVHVCANFTDHLISNVTNAVNGTLNGTFNGTLNSTANYVASQVTPGAMAAAGVASTVALSAAQHAGDVTTLAATTAATTATTTAVTTATTAPVNATANATAPASALATACAVADRTLRIANAAIAAVPGVAGGVIIGGGCSLFDYFRNRRNNPANIRKVTEEDHLLNPGGGMSNRG